MLQALKDSEVDEPKPEYSYLKKARKLKMSVTTPETRITI